MKEETSIQTSEDDFRLSAFAVIKALEKTVEKLTDTKNRDSLYSSIRETAIRDYETMGSTGREVRLFGERVGQLSIVKPKEVPQEVKHVLCVDDYEQLARWFDSLMRSEQESYAARGLKQFAEWWKNETGEVAEGCHLEEEITPAYMTAPSTRIKIDDTKVISILKDRDQLPPVFTNILGGATNDD